MVYQKLCQNSVSGWGSGITPKKYLFIKIRKVIFLDASTCLFQGMIAGNRGKQVAGKCSQCIIWGDVVFDPR